MPCAVCGVDSRNQLLMIPGRDRCPSGWHEEYDGYLATQPIHLKSRSQTICVDENAQGITGRSHNEGIMLLQLF